MNSRRNGQAMVEFAIALPFLLLVLFGILEVGRLIFTYSGVVNASREGVRYGSATGYVAGTGSDFRWEDCSGIQQAAIDRSFGGITDPLDVEVYYFDPSGGPIGNCEANHGDAEGLRCNWESEPWPPYRPADDGHLTANVPTNIQTGSRVMVCTTGQWYSLVPGITGISRNDCGPDCLFLHSRSARTILSNIYLSGGAYVPPATAVGGAFDTPKPSNTPTHTNTPTETPTPCGYPLATCTPTVTPTQTDTPTTTPTPTLTPTQTPTPICPLVSLEDETRPGGTTIYTVTFTNNGAAATNATSITISWPATTSAGTHNLISGSSNPGGSFFSGSLSGGGPVTFQLTSGSFPLGIPMGSGGSQTLFTFTWDRAFPNGINRNHVNGSITINPVPPGCGGTSINY